MLVLKIISIIYMTVILLCFISLDCKTNDVSESTKGKILSILQAGALAYIIIK